MNWKKTAIYAVVGIAVLWISMELHQWNTERRLANLPSEVEE